jgi:hypothetical protein
MKDSPFEHIQNLCVALYTKPSRTHYLQNCAVRWTRTELFERTVRDNNQDRIRGETDTHPAAQLSEEDIVVLAKGRIRGVCKHQIICWMNVFCVMEEFKRRRRLITEPYLNIKGTNMRHSSPTTSEKTLMGYLRQGAVSAADATDQAAVTQGYTHGCKRVCKQDLTSQTSQNGLNRSFAAVFSSQAPKAYTTKSIIAATVALLLSITEKLSRPEKLLHPLPCS